jgi:hypothetical protein
MVNKVIVEDNTECAFPNIEISLRIFLTLMVTNCKTERSFSQMKRIENPKRTTMRREAGILIQFLNVIKGTIQTETLQIVFFNRSQYWQYLEK